MGGGGGGAIEGRNGWQGGRFLREAGGRRMAGDEVLSLKIGAELWNMMKGREGVLRISGGWISV